MRCDGCGEDVCPGTGKSIFVRNKKIFVCDSCFEELMKDLGFVKDAWAMMKERYRMEGIE